MTGGNQLKLSSIVCGTPLGDAIVAAHERGLLVGGTSAGASIQSSHMLAFGGPGSTPKQRMTQMAAGLGLMDSAVIDQHFDQRNRYGRLLMIVAQSPQLLGIGVDEDTAAVVEHADTPRAAPRAPHRRRQGCGDHPRPGPDHHQRVRGQTLGSHPRQRGGAAHAAGRVVVRPHVADAGRPGRRGDRRGRGRDRRGRARPAPDGPRHRRVGRVSQRPAASPGPHSQERPRTESPHDRTPYARPHHPRDTGLPRRQHLVLREGHPPRSRPGPARGVPHQHHPGVHRQPAGDAAGPARALVLAGQARRLRGAAQRRHLAGPRRRAHGAGPAAGRRSRHPPGQDPRCEGPEGPLQRDLRLRRRTGRPRRRPARRTPGQPPGRGGSGVRLVRGARVVHPARGAYGVRALHPGDPRRGGLARHPVDPPQPVLPRPARPGRPREADPGHDDQRDVRDRGRHRLRQGPHHAAARGRRPARAQAGHRPECGRGRPGRGADRLSLRAEAARWQPRPRRLPRPDERGRRARGVRGREGGVARGA